MIPIAEFKEPFFALLAEIFGVADTPHGFMLDTGTSGLIGTITTLSAETASAAPSDDHATIASHCGHLLFLLNLFLDYERGKQIQPDWASSWKTRVVDDAAWQTLRDDLQRAYNDVVAAFRAREEWPQQAVGAAMMLIGHSAYHVGEIKQRLLWVNA
jgi:hypothetical protein